MVIRPDQSPGNYKELVDHQSWNTIFDYFRLLKPLMVDRLLRLSFRNHLLQVI